MRFKNILYAEDDPNDVIIFNMILQRAKLPAMLRTVDDGQAAMDWLSGKGEYSDREHFPRPDVLILDLKMPKKNGFEVLEWLGGQRGFEQLPVLMLSSSDVPADAQHAYRLGATQYFVKSPTFRDVIHYLQTT
jgi:CheY-like chemotaxis protein